MNKILTFQIKSGSVLLTSFALGSSMTRTAVPVISGTSSQEVLRLSMSFNEEEFVS